MSDTSSDSSSNSGANGDVHTLNESFTPSVCSEKEITQSVKSHSSHINKAFDYNRYKSDNKENVPFTNYLSAAHVSHMTNQQQDKSFSTQTPISERRLDMNQNSQAIAGAMRALQRKIHSLE